MDESIINGSKRGWTSNQYRTMLSCVLIGLVGCFGVAGYVGYKGYVKSEERTDNFTAEVIGVWFISDRSKNYFTIRLPNEEVKDILVGTGLGFAGKTGDAIFGTVTNGVYTVKGIRRTPWVEVPPKYVGVLKDNRSAAEKELDRLKQVEALLKKEIDKDYENAKKLFNKLF